MALQAVSAVAIHAGTFRNVDLPHQGLYHLRCCLYKHVDGQLSPVVPHLLQPQRDVDSRALLPARVLDSDNVFRTKSVFIRFSDEEAVLDDIVQFHIERESGSKLQLQLEVKLMYADLCDGELPVDAGKVSTPRVLASKLGHAQFHELSTKMFRLHGAAEHKHMHAHCPCVFEDNYFCHVGLMVHSTLLDFRLRLSPATFTLSPYSRPASKLAHTGAPDAANCCTSRDAATPGRGGAGPNGFRPASLADDLVRLAGGAAPPRPPCSSATSEIDDSVGLTPRDGPASQLVAAVDEIQRKYVGQLSDARQGLINFLQAVPRQRWPGNTPRRRQPETSTPRGERASPMHPQEAGGPDLKFRRFLPPGHDAQRGYVNGKDLKPVSISKRYGGCVAGPVAAMRLAEDLSYASSQVADVWTALLASLSWVREDVSDFLYHKWEKEMMKCWSEHVFREVRPVSEVATASNGRLREERGRAAAEVRALQSRGSLARAAIEDSSQCARPVLFEQRYAPDSAQSEHERLTARSEVGGHLLSTSSSSLGTPRSARRRGSYMGIHVFILVHGFQGGSFDMRLVKSSVSSLFPTALCLCSEANEEDTEGDIGQMGSKLAEEVRAFVQEWCPGGLASGTRSPRGPSLGRLSFICHSVGGLIARAALPELAREYGNLFYTFMTLSSPHLGYMYSQSAMFKTGLWVASKVRRSVCLEQLSMGDRAAGDEECYLMTLSKQEGLSHFKHVVLLASQQDTYAPFESARLEMAESAKRDAKFGHVYAEMLQNILAPLKPDRIIRFDIDFGLTEVSLDTMIGRAAHIQFIESQELMKMLTHMYSFLFE